MLFRHGIGDVELALILQHENRRAGYDSTNPCGTIGVKSSRLLVASGAWARMAMAAMQQSA